MPGLSENSTSASGDCSKKSELKSKKISCSQDRCAASLFANSCAQALENTSYWLKNESFSQRVTWLARYREKLPVIARA